MSARSGGELIGLLPRRAFVTRLEAELAERAVAVAPTYAVGATRIAVVADTHCHGDALPAALLAAAADCDLVVHCGDLGDMTVLDRLESIAPVLAVRTENDPAADGRRLHDGPRLLRAGRTLIGVAADLPAHDAEALTSVFGTAVDVALCGTTHRPSVDESGSALVVNPGSPTVPAGGSSPSIAVVELHAGRPAARIVTLPES